MDRASGFVDDWGTSYADDFSGEEDDAGEEGLGADDSEEDELLALRLASHAGTSASAAGGSGSSDPTGVPVYVMLPLDTVWVVDREGRKVSVLKKERSLEIALHTLKQAGVEGVMVDVWWGIVERQPRQYDFSAYHSLFRKVSRAGLKVQAVMSFHAAGGNVGDTCTIPLPKWVLEVGETNLDIFYTDKSGYR
jgi:hypothetical protein